jgi:type II secretory pathway component PulL
LTRKHRWYEKLFFKLQLREKKCFWLMLSLLLLIILSQILLADFAFRKYLVLVERYEGQPVKFYKSLKAQ